MPIQTNLSTSPYFDDFDETKNYHRVLFKPSVAVQVRELNQLQRILQSQIERFGDNIFKRGTIIDGCNFTFLDKLSYAKLLDTDIASAPVNVSSFKNFYAKDSANLIGIVVETANGFESTAPDLNTIFLRFLNSGNTFSETKFTKNSILEIYNANNVVQRVKINEGGTDFSNTDEVVITSALAVQNTTGGSTFDSNTWIVNTKVTQDTTGARGEILEVNTTANSESVILKIRPLETDVTNADSTSTLWRFSPGYTITADDLGATTANASANGLVVGLAGTGAAAALLTDSTGKITTIAVTSEGSGYYTPPHVTVFSNTGSVASLNLESQGYLARVTVQNDDTATGNAYGVSVGEGVIYQKGHFIRVAPQLKVVEKYANSTTPDAKVVGFDTTETFVDYNDDPSLLDNALGTFNYTAPGADRLKLSPTLVVLDTAEADANTDFLPIIEFNKGKPFRQLRTTQYNKIQNEISKRTFEESGNYVVDQFRSVTTSPISTSEANTFDLVVDTGIAYINGNRVETFNSFTGTIDKGIDTTTATDVGIEINYGNYLRVNEVGGYFKFNTGDVVDLYNTARLYTSNTEITGTTPSPAGTKIGSARMKSLVYESGEPGSTAVYRLYLFDISMSNGYNFKDVRSLYYNGATYKGYADAVLERTGTSTSNVAVLQFTNNDKLVFDTGFKAVANLTSVDYRYRSTNVVSMANTGFISSTVATGTLPYVGNLNSAEKADVIVVPLANLVTDNISTASVINTNNIISLSNSSLFTALKPGDYLRIYGTAESKVRRVTGYSPVAANGTANGLSVTLDRVVDLASSNTAANVAFTLPQYAPVQLSTRVDRVANVNGTDLRIYLNPPANFTTTGNVAVTYTAKRTAVAPTVKTTNRKTLVKLRLANNAATDTGPWCLGVNDIFRLRNVYIANTSTVNTNSTNVTNDFFIDHNQTENSYGLGYLYKKPTSTLALDETNDYLLVEFDNFIKSGDAVYSVSSYTKDDGAGNSSVTTLESLSLSAANVHSLEIPEMYTSRGEYFDLRDTLDFRVGASNTAAITSTLASATINPAIPSHATAIDTINEKYFPEPESDVSFDIVKYESRNDLVVLTSNGDFQVIKGVPGANITRAVPPNSILINSLSIKEYPSLPENLSANTLEVLDKKISNIKYTNERQNLYTVSKAVTDDNIQYEQPSAYRMSDIGSIDRRLKNIEYRVDLRDIDDEVKNLAIKSSVDASINRFKFGFFVDNFTSTNFSDFDNPEYSALNFNNRLSVPRDQINIKHKFYNSNTTTAALISGKIATLPYEEYTAVKQLSATEPTPPVVVANTVVAQSRTCIEVVNRNGAKVQDRFVTFSSTAGVAKLYMGAIGEDRWEIYQSTSPQFTVPTSGSPLPAGTRLVVTSESAQAIPTEDRNELASLKALPNAIAAGKWDLKSRPNVTFGSKSGNSKYWIKNHGYLSWSHDPSQGLYYMVRVIRNTTYHDYRLCYPVDATTNVTQTIGTPVKMTYEGKVVSQSPGKISIGYKSSGGYYGYPYTYVSRGNPLNTQLTGFNLGYYSGYNTISGIRVYPVANETSMTVEIRGLKPNTKHDFYFGDQLYNSSATPLFGQFKNQYGQDTVGGSTLISDDSGNLKFKWFFKSGLVDSITRTAYVKNQVANNLINVNKVAKIKSSDDVSTATWNIGVNWYGYQYSYYNTTGVLGLNYRYYWPF